MKCCRSGAGVASLGQYIYAVGGYDGKSQLSSVERYDIERDIWEPVSSVSVARSALSLTALGGKLYAMGKYSFKIDPQVIYQVGCVSKHVKMKRNQNVHFILGIMSVFVRSVFEQVI